MLNIDKSKLTPILKSFNLLTKLNVAIYSKEMEEIAKYPGNSCFCSSLYNSAAADCCIQSNQHAYTLCKELNRSIIYKCPFQIWDTISPLKHNNQIIGYIMVGQARAITSLRESDLALFQRLTKQFHLDSNQLLKNFKRLPYATEEYIKASLDIINACVTHLYISNIISEKDNFLIDCIENYIEQNLHNPISIKILCDTIHLSKAQLYRIFNRSFNAVTIQQYIKKKRIAKAKYLLKNSQLSVSEIAIMVGIPDYNYFNKVFSQEVGLSPSKFRKS